MIQRQYLQGSIFAAEIGSIEHEVRNSLAQTWHRENKFQCRVESLFGEIRDDSEPREKGRNTEFKAPRWLGSLSKTLVRNQSEQK